MTKPLVVVVYSPKDEQENNQLLSHLGILSRSGTEVWSDDQIKGGADWKEETDQAITQAQVAILFITANFLNSSLIMDAIVPKLLEHENKGLRVLPVIARACAWQEVDWLTKMNVRPEGCRPIWRADSPRVDEDLTTIVKEVADIIKNNPLITPTDGEVYGKSERAIHSLLGGYNPVSLTPEQEKIYRDSYKPSVVRVDTPLSLLTRNFSKESFGFSEEDVVEVPEYQLMFSRSKSQENNPGSEMTEKPDTNKILQLIGSWNPFANSFVKTEDKYDNAQLIRLINQLNLATEEVNDQLIKAKNENDPDQQRQYYRYAASLTCDILGKVLEDSQYHVAVAGLTQEKGKHEVELIEHLGGAVKFIILLTTVGKRLLELYDPAIIDTIKEGRSQVLQKILECKSLDRTLYENVRYIHHTACEIRESSTLPNQRLCEILIKLTLATGAVVTVLVNFHAQQNGTIKGEQAILSSMFGSAVISSYVEEVIELTGLRG